MEQQMGSAPSRQNEQMQMSADEIVGIKIDMQIRLANEHGQDINDFIEAHAKDFGDFVGTNQNVLERYRHDPDGVIKEVEKIIYH